uniref:Protein kinase domain-containing protein n=1 Tax=Rhabditophanes sp. KR3021 TaxID=114890 RepID=A0AC35TS71_9BILA
MITSPYLQYASPNCEISLEYKITGGLGVVSTQGLPDEDFAASEDVNAEEDVDALTRPSEHLVIHPTNPNFQRWKNESVHIGGINRPTRIRIECHIKDTTSCYIDNLKLNNCDEEIYVEDACDGKDDKKYLCDKGHQNKCIKYSEVCDMNVDCNGGEDENNFLHQCNEIPIGARCTFESDDPNLCEGWKLENVKKHFNRPFQNSQSIKNSHLFQLTSAILIGKKYPNNKKIFAHHDHTYGHHNNTGHFMSIMSQDDSMGLGMLSNPVRTNMISPFFPPMHPSIFDTLSPNYGTCFIHFHLCYIAKNIPSIDIKLVSASGKEKVTIFDHTYPHETNPGYCLWRKYSIKFPDFRSSYQVIISTATQYEHYDSFGFDDFTMSPNCFLRINDWVNPQLKQSVTIASHKDFEKGGLIKLDDQMNPTLVVPHTMEYKIDVCGAAGGKLLNQRYKNNGGCITYFDTFQKGHQLKFSNGEIGQSPCDVNKTVSSTLPPGMSEAYLKVVCAGSQAEAEQRYTKMNEMWQGKSELPGTGGGGASFVLYDNEYIVVAGGGGGSIAEVFLNQVLINNTALGGILFDPDTYDNSSLLVPNWKAGNGGSEGGVGGGGASCSNSGGGGGGYIGGSTSAGSYGNGGLSYVLKNKEFYNYIGENKGSGFITITACSLECSESALCTFERDHLVVFSNGGANQLCVCEDGSFVGERQPCNTTFTRDNDRVGLTDHPKLVWFIIILVMLITSVGVLYCLINKYCVHLSRNKENSTQIMRAENNGLYHMINIENTPESMRIRPEEIAFLNSIGEGAFGKVYKAIYTRNGLEQQTVAVKTLPLDSARDCQMGFEREAALMNKYPHPNIVSLLGVVFEPTANFIVIELMEGGDLKTFLRECRPRSIDRIMNIDMYDLNIICHDIASACAHLEKHRLIHRDIAARNCLTTAKQSNCRRVTKLADFGLARDIKISDYYVKEGKAMLPVKWMPPEAFLDGVFSSQSDQWSFGVLMWEVYSLGLAPYPGKDNDEVMQFVLEGQRLNSPECIPKLASDLMLMTWSTLPHHRPTFADCEVSLGKLLEDSSWKGYPVPDISPFKIGQALNASSRVKREVLTLESMDLISNANSAQTLSTMIDSSHQYDSEITFDPTANFLPYELVRKNKYRTVENAYINTFDSVLYQKGDDNDSLAETPDNEIALAAYLRDNFINPGRPNTAGSRRPIISEDDELVWNSGKE